ncbi:Cof-type HAD-IIB family hydrolase [Desertibacillus haloalkaliphilus]|uniref:Cof-type HAD-IIB family hydrolase n=1 Tax=Desertibacillus haloalkaliphilus TaxID=1328930 RepID=UPI001C278F66|nr:Cof-type HAD-IIB family hydrolase [Desertibacillus haloalkaliphilus]MBU8905432.1 Cof-type HAD-IIB family hydrolase [Desertibacillus haloalkaliphilus]
MTYRLLALNIDGTLLRSNSRISRQTKDAIEYAKQKGAVVTLATERPFPSAKKIAKSLKIDHELITHDGAFIASDIEDPVYERRLHEDKAFHIVELLENYHCHIRLLHESFSVGNKVRQKNQLIAKMTIGLGDPVFYPLSFVDSLSEHLLQEPIAPPKIKAQFMNEDDRERAIEELEREVPNIRITRATDDHIEIVPEGVSKARGLQILGNRLGISLNEMVAIGVGENDVDMITQAGLGVAMGNAPENVKQSADWITRSNNQNGVSYMVREVFRKQLRVKL